MCSQMLRQIRDETKLLDPTQGFHILKDILVGSCHINLLPLLALENKGREYQLLRPLSRRRREPMGSRQEAVFDFRSIGSFGRTSA